MNREQLRLIFRISLYSRIGVLVFLIALSLFDKMQLILTAKALIVVVSVFAVYQCWKIARPLWATIFGFIATIYLPFFTWNASVYDENAIIPGIANIVVLLIVFTSLFLVRVRKDKNADS